MSTEDDVTLVVDGDFSQLYAKLSQQLPAEAQESAKHAAKLMQQEMDRVNLVKAVKGLGSVTQKEAEKAASAIQKEMRRAEFITEQAAASMRNDLKQGLGAVVGSGPINDITDIAGAITAIGPAAGTAAVGVAAAAASIGAMVYVSYQLTRALYDAALATGELDDENRALAEAQRRVVEAVADGVIPTFEGLTIGATALTLAFADLVATEERGWAAILNHRDAQDDLNRAIIDGLAPGLQQLDMIRDLGRGLEDGTISLGGYADKARELQKIMEQLNEQRSNDKAAIEAAERAKKFMTDEAARVRRLGERIMAERRRGAAEQQRLDDEAERYATELSNLQGRQFLQAMEDDDNLTAQILGNIDAIGAAQAKTYAEKIAMGEALRARQVELDENATRAEILHAQEISTAWNAAYNGIGQAVDAVTGAIIAGAADGTEAQRQAAETAWTVSQAFSIGQAGVSGIQMGIGMAAQLAPLLGPAAPATAAAIAIPFTAAQVAAIAATPAPFHGGTGDGGVPAYLGGNAPGLANDEVSTKLRVGERVQTRQQQNEGNTFVLINKVDHKVASMTTQRQLKTSNSALKKAIDAANPRRLGHSGVS